MAFENSNMLWEDVPVPWRILIFVPEPHNYSFRFSIAFTKT